ncbi:MAG: transferase hexapeptide repeat family protein [Flavobacteriales bacterium]|nr:transferase hexapeptide repeat family protein [Flavobacteriales bacterium]
MANVFSFKGFTPVIHDSSFVHPHAAVTGNVTIGKNCYIGPVAAIRGDWGEIIIKDGCNVQENCTVHMFPGLQTILEESAHIGHGAVIHGGHIGRNSLIGMNSVVMDGAVIGDECIIGAMTFVPAKIEVPKRSLMVGNPGKVIKEVSDEMLAWKTQGTQLYQALPGECHAYLQPAEPLREAPNDKPSQDILYKTWNEIQNS